MIRIVSVAIAVCAMMAESSALSVNQPRRSVDTCGVAKNKLGLIVFGQSFPRGSFPWIVALMHTGTRPPQFFCGGTLISKTFVITAAHCILEKHAAKQFLPRDILAVFGAHDLSDSFEIGRILLSPKKIFVHDDWNHLTESFDADVSLLEFGPNKIHFDDYIQPICLWDSENEPTVTEGVVTGWGKSEDPSKIHENKPKLTTAPIQSQEQCFLSTKALVDLSSSRTFCAGLRNGSGVCSGDSGGGLFINMNEVFYLRGIVSSSLIKESSCDVSKNAVYTNVIKFREWIAKITATNIKTTVEEVELELDTLLPRAPYCGTMAADRIFGGEEAKVYEFPWLALLQYRKLDNELGFHCGGSVINNRYVLTAAQCLQKIPSIWKLIKVRIGEWDLLSEQDCDPDEEDLCLPPVQDIRISKEIVHPKYRKENQHSHYDIALLRLSMKVRFGEFIRPICLPLAKHLQNKDYSGERLIAAGWGKTENVTKSTKKLFVSLPFFDHDECVEAFSGHKTLNEHQMCAGGILGEDACKGDSGGPLMSKDLVNGLGPYYLAGIVSYGAAECGAEGFPGVYTKVSNFLEWIVANIRA